MPSTDESLITKVQAAYQQLSAAAITLNSASDELGKSVAALDAALKRLNLGITAWVTVDDYDCPDPFYRADQVGYDKIGGKWGIGLRTISGNYTDPEHESSQEWLFNDASRSLRVAAVEKIPELIEELTKAADATTKKINEKLKQAKELAAAINAIADRQ